MGAVYFKVNNGELQINQRLSFDANITRFDFDFEGQGNFYPGPTILPEERAILIQGLLQAATYEMGTSRLEVRPDWVGYYSAQEFRALFDCDPVGESWIETDTDTLFVQTAQGTEDHYVVSFWDRPDVRLEYMKVLSLPVRRESKTEGAK